MLAACSQSLAAQVNVDGEGPSQYHGKTSDKAVPATNTEGRERLVREKREREPKQGSKSLGRVNCSAFRDSLYQ